MKVVFVTVLKITLFIAITLYPYICMAQWPGQCTYEYTNCASVTWGKVYINNNYTEMADAPPIFNGQSYYWPSTKMSIAGTYYDRPVSSYCYVWMKYWQIDPYYPAGGFWQTKAFMTFSNAGVFGFNGSDGMGFNTAPPPASGCPDCSQQRADLATQCGGEENIINWDSVACTGDCDECPSDLDKTAPGICGCGVPDTDTDGDGTPDCNDGCPKDPTTTDPIICIADQNLGNPCQ
jgi:hypothetical protein